mmetsp:Transcript_4735/g.12043  ORF Transcript_4735/g.12043 Transcript_4735/m.12043 type:complete len:610 (-) Transcript_4735:153-1982(-)
MVVNFLSMSQHTKERALQARERHGLGKGQQSKNQSARTSRKSSILSSLGKFLDDHNDYGGINDGENDDDHDCLLMNNNSSSNGDDPTESTYQQSFSDASFLTGASSSPGALQAQGQRKAGRRGSVTKFSLDNTNPSASLANTIPEPAFQQQQEENGAAHPPARRAQRRGGCTMYVTDKDVDSHQQQQQQAEDHSAAPQPSRRIHRRGGCTLYVTDKDVDSDELSVSSAMSAPVAAASSTKKKTLRNAFTGLSLNIKSTHSHQEELHEQHRHSRPPLTNRNLDYSAKPSSSRGHHGGAGGHHHHQPQKKRLSFNGFQSHLHRPAGGNDHHHHGDDDDDCSVGSVETMQSVQTVQTIDSMPIPMRPKIKTASSVRRPKPLGESLQGLSSQSCHVTPSQVDADGFPDPSPALLPSSSAMSVQSTPASSSSASAITKTKKKKKAKTEETKKKTKKTTKKSSSADDGVADTKTKKKKKTKKGSSPKLSIPSTIGGYDDHVGDYEDVVVGTTGGGRRLSVESTLSDVTGGGRRLSVESGFSNGSGGFVGGDDRRLSVDSTLSMELSLYEEDGEEDDDDDAAAAEDNHDSPPRRKNSLKGRRVQRRGSVTKFSLDE